MAFDENKLIFDIITATTTKVR